VKIAEVAPTIGLLFSMVKAMYQLSRKTDWATFWATFLQTHLVTLLAIQCYLPTTGLAS
jgi:hypothetical protein